MRPDEGEFVVGVCGDVEVVGQDVERDVADYLADLGVGNTGCAGALDHGLVDRAAAPGDGVEEAKDGGCVRVGGIGVASALDLVVIELGDVLA